MKANHQLHYRLHSWCGIVLGGMLYLLCFSGTVAVYKDELVQWCNPSLPAGDSSSALSYNERFAKLKTQLPEDDLPRRLTLPSGAYGVHELRSAGGIRVVAGAQGEPVAERNVQLADFFVNLHTRIFLAHEGRWLIGVAGFGLLGSLLSGLLTHRRLLSNPLRQKPSSRQRLVSWHKLMGVAGLPAYLIFALTGIWLGLYGVIIPASGYLQNRFAGSRQTSVETVATESSTQWQVGPEDRSLDGLLAHTSSLIPGFEPVFIDWAPQKKNEPATVAVRGNLPGSLIQRHRVGVTYHAEQGTVLAVHAPGFLLWQQRLHDSMMPLHVGDWGGQLIKLIYFTFGSLSTVLCFSGLWAWADRRSRQAAWASGPANWPRHIVIGVVGTGSLCIVLVPLLVRLGVTGDLQSHFLWMWFAAAIGYLCLSRIAGRSSSFQKTAAVPSLRQWSQSLPKGTVAFFIHAIVTTGWGYTQYLTSRAANDASLQELASWWMLTGLTCLLATVVGCFYARTATVLRAVAVLSLVIAAAQGVMAAALLLSLLGICIVSRIRMNDGHAETVARLASCEK